MPVRKPRGRKRPSHRRAYLSIVLLILLGGSSITYIYLNGFFPGGSPASSTSATTTVAGCPTPPISASGDVFACVKTPEGSFEVELFTGSAPKTVANFVALARSGFYNNLIWHRITASPAVIQTGDPLTRGGGGNRSDWGTGGSSNTVPLEVSNSSLHNDRGYLGMARGQDVNSGSSQFYINTQDNRGLDGSYTVFGRVTSGIAVVDGISRLPTYTNPNGLYYEQPLDPSRAVLISITILSGG
ncbi:MAG TPA: peptidylprolyl isomerase [Nitrososphaerales archaeon]|nr:peptidylprolyl isomerase [Nitrososphaerales archaeon]